MKAKRQSKILEIIQNKPIETQEELLCELQNAGFFVTQATVSRDMKELRLTKVHSGEGVSRYAVLRGSGTQVSEKFSQLFHDAITEMDYACNMVVIKCHAGMAQAACAAMDSLHFPTVVGTLAGDDTFVCITKSNEDAIALVEELRSR